MANMDNFFYEMLLEMNGCSKAVVLVDKIDNILTDIDCIQIDSHIDPELSYYNNVVEDGSYYKYPSETTLDQLELFSDQVKIPFKKIDKLLNLVDSNYENVDDNHLTSLVKSKLSICNYFSELSNSDNCMICLNKFEDNIQMFICGHYLCSNCFNEIRKKWCDSFGECPYCQKTVSKREMIEFRSSDSTLGLNTQLINLMVNEKINRDLLELIEYYQMYVMVNNYFTSRLIDYIDIIETADRRRLLEVEQSAYQQIVDLKNEVVTKDLSDFVNIWMGFDSFNMKSYCSYFCFEDISQNIQSLCDKLGILNINCESYNKMIGWLTYQICKGNNTIEKWIEWLKLNVPNIPISGQFEDSPNYAEWNRNMETKIIQNWKTFESIKNGSLIAESINSNSVASLIAFLKYHCQKKII